LIGKTIAHYRVGVKLGQGGMGEVYQATDTKLNRNVALKVLPEEFAKDHDRMARFKREAQLLASLNHTNIAAIYGLEEENGVQAIVLELVEGPTLSDRIKQGAIPLDEALNISKQIAEALESAHEQGVIHRDLKPANVKVKEDGQVKVLDFGLAKALEGEMTEEEIGNSPTLSVASTRAGVILGTAAYMSPEQAAGKKADRRADIWSFGVVLFEMLTGQRLFTGESAVEVMSRVMRDDPGWDLLPSATPAAIRKLLRRCLTKDRKQRMQAIGDARFEIEEALTGPTSADEATVAVPQPAWKAFLPWAAGALAIALVVSLWAPWRAGVAPAPVRLSVNVTTDDRLFTGYGPFMQQIQIHCSEKPRTVTFYGQKLGRLLEFEPFAKARLNDIDEALIATFVQMRAKQVAPATVNRELATLRRLLRLAQEWKVIDRVPRIRMLPGERQREFVLNHAQEKLYLTMAPQPLRDVALLLLDTGLRVGEASKLRWTDISLRPAHGAKYGYLRVREGKSQNAKRVVSLTSRVKTMLEARYLSHESPFAFPGKDPASPILVTSLNHIQLKLRKLLKMNEEFVLHSLRHTMLTRLGEAGVEAFTIMRIAGHSSVTVSQRYVHPTPEALERAFERLEALNVHAEKRLLSDGKRLPPATVSATLEEEAAVSP